MEFRKNTVKTALAIRDCDGKSDKQVALLKELIQNGTESDLTNLNNGDGVPLSANLNLILRGVRADKVKVFTSATKPLLLPFYFRYKGDDADQANTFTMMFKTGDDMRQDQLVLQLFSIMDRVLKDVNLDCKFTIYDLIAFTTDDGLLPFVPDSETITAILREHKGIGAYLKSHAKDDDDYERILNNYISSCAGYCTATYLLGIGDRHLENLMITKDGKFFHIDFGFIFGKEPNSSK